MVYPQLTNFLGKKCVLVSNKQEFGLFHHVIHHFQTIRYSSHSTDMVVAFEYQPHEMIESYLGILVTGGNWLKQWMITQLLTTIGYS